MDLGRVRGGAIAPSKTTPLHGQVFLPSFVLIFQLHIQLVHLESSMFLGALVWLLILYFGLRYDYPFTTLKSGAAYFEECSFYICTYRMLLKLIFLIIFYSYLLRKMSSEYSEKMCFFLLIYSILPPNLPNSPQIDWFWSFKKYSARIARISMISLNNLV